MPTDELGRLRRIVPFRYLGTEALQCLCEDSAVRSFAPGELLIRQGDPESDEVFVLLSGSVEFVDVAKAPPFRLNVVEEGSYFGERSCLLGSPRPFDARALEASTCLVIPGARFLELLSESRPFAQAFGTKLRDGMGIFDAFDRFNAEVARMAAQGHIEIRRLVELYKALEPALHPFASDEGRIDWGALAYATRRLPANLTRTFVFLLTDNLPTVYASPERLFPFVPTEARHRFVYEMLRGKDIVLIRDGLSDLVDFITCLCAFAVEARKIRYRLNHPDLILAVASSRPGSGLEGMPFDEEEKAELRSLWPEDTVSRLREIVFHRQAFAADVRKQVNNYNGRLSELWSSQVGEATRALLGVDPSDLPDELEIHIISSNTHSVSNCLNPFFQDRAVEVLRWAEEAGLRRERWGEGLDEVYHFARAWLEALPARKAELVESERGCGIHRLPETVTTGIQVQLIDAGSIGSNSASCVPPLDRERPSLIVNIDYAFGEQAEEIMRCLLLLFGRNVRSINVLGKAGALIGDRGDVLAPTAFIEQANDAFQPLPGEAAASLRRLRAALPGRRILAGPLLTVGGTLLQNRAMLQFYRRIWGCVGLEMEGIWYLRAVLEAEELGLLRPGARKRFLYYVSDLPLRAGHKLSERLSPREGIPPLYAITREILRDLVGGGRAPPPSEVGPDIVQ